MVTLVQYFMDLVIWEIWGNGFESLTVVQIGKKSSRDIIAKYCFFLNMVRLNGTLNFLYLPKRMSKSPSGSFLCLEGLLFLSPCWNLNWSSSLWFGHCFLQEVLPDQSKSVPWWTVDRDYTRWSCLTIIFICTKKETMGNYFQIHDSLNRGKQAPFIRAWDEYSEG